MSTRLYTYALLLLALITLTFASSGDRDENYRKCVSNCESLVCSDSAWASSLPIALSLTRWSCTDDCKYGCMHSITDRALASSIPVQQYHGKWPFWRFAGMQEPASVAFSLLNLACHARGARRMQKLIPDGHPLKPYYMRFAFISMNAWIWSSVFHTRGW